MTILNVLVILIKPVEFQKQGVKEFISLTASLTTNFRQIFKDEILKNF